VKVHERNRKMYDLFAGAQREDADRCPRPRYAALLLASALERIQIRTVHWVPQRERYIRIQDANYHFPHHSLPLTHGFVILLINIPMA